VDVSYFSVKQRKSEVSPKLHLLNFVSEARELDKKVCVSIIEACSTNPSLFKSS
jgi:hypothetical protein